MAGSLLGISSHDSTIYCLRITMIWYETAVFVDDCFVLFSADKTVSSVFQRVLIRGFSFLLLPRSTTVVQF